VSTIVKTTREGEEANKWLQAAAQLEVPYTFRHEIVRPPGASRVSPQNCSQWTLTIEVEEPPTQRLEEMRP
jgi:hypothetical protein